MDKKIKLSPKSLWFLFVAFSISIICVGGYSPYFMTLRIPLFVIIAVSSIIYTVFIYKKVTMDYVLSFFLITSAYMLVSAIMSPNYDTAIKTAIVYICGTAMLTVEFPNDFYKVVLKVISIFCIVIAISIILSVFIDDFMIKSFSWFLNPKNNPDVINNIHREISVSKSYSGLAREKGVAAYIMGIGILIYFSKFFSGIKLKVLDIIFLIAEIVALMLTSKRMIIICLLVAFAVMMLISSKKSKLIKLIMISLLAFCGFIILSSYIPQLSNVFNRFNNDEADMLTGRGALWQCSLYMFGLSPLFGNGLLSFNTFAEQLGITNPDGTPWLYNGHNIYYEFLGELGVVGSIIVFGTLLYAIVKTVILLKAENLSEYSKFLLMFSFAVQLVLLLYCATGNVLISADQTFILIFAISIMRSIKLRTKRAVANEMQ